MLRMTLRAATLVVSLATGATSAGAESDWIRVEGGWVPGPHVLREIRAGLQPYVERQAHIQRRKLRNWGQYTFQYQGREEKGHRYVFVNALCHRDPSWNLEKRMVLVLDGGSCFFQLKVDPEQRRYYELIINGEA